MPYAIVLHAALTLIDQTGTVIYKINRPGPRLPPFPSLCCSTVRRRRIRGSPATAAPVSHLPSSVVSSFGLAAFVSKDQIAECRFHPGSASMGISGCP